MTPDPTELARVLAALDILAETDACDRDAARLLREMAVDFARAGKRCDALDKMLVAYRVGRPPSEATFGAIEKHSREWLDAARAKWRLEP